MKGTFTPVMSLFKGKTSFFPLLLMLLGLGIFSSCSVDDPLDAAPEVETGTLSIGGLDVRMRNATTTFARTESFSTWDHIFPDELTLNLENTATGVVYPFVFNPNTLNPSVTITLPYGFYRYSLETTGSEFEEVLLFDANGVFELNSPTYELEVNGVTDYGLVTLSSNLVSSVSISSASETRGMVLTGDGLFYYIYVIDGTELTLDIVESYSNTDISTVFTMGNNEHFHYEIETPSEGELSIVIVLEPFNLTETTFLIGAIRDIDGNTYRTTRIGSQIWTAKNLETSRFRNGDVIAQATSVLEWQTLVASNTPAWAFYAYNSANGPVYGKLYNWYAVNDPRGLAPEGFHVATDSDWQTLLTEVGSNPGGPLKQAGFATWNSPNEGATDFYGFSALAGGWGMQNGPMVEVGLSTVFWTSTGTTSNNAFAYSMSSTTENVNRFAISRNSAFYVRLVRD